MQSASCEILSWEKGHCTWIGLDSKHNIRKNHRITWHQGISKTSNIIISKDVILHI